MYFHLISLYYLFAREMEWPRWSSQSIDLLVSIWLRRHNVKKKQRKTVKQKKSHVTLLSLYLRFIHTQLDISNMKIHHVTRSVSSQNASGIWQYVFFTASAACAVPKSQPYGDSLKRWKMQFSQEDIHKDITQQCNLLQILEVLFTSNTLL